MLKVDLRQHAGRTVALRLLAMRPRDQLQLHSWSFTSSDPGVRT